MEKLIKFSKSAWAIVWQSGEFAVQFKQSVCLSPKSDASCYLFSGKSLDITEGRWTFPWGEM